jgi:hypothetical protein
MTDAANHVQPKSEGTTEAPASNSVAADSRNRQPYRAPRLRQLGSVRHLTLGSVGIAFDANCSGPGGTTPPENCG